MKYFASCSFGKDSIASVILAHENNEPLDTIIYSRIMYDTEKGISGEVPEHEDFINRCAIPWFEKWGYEVVTVQSPKDYKWNFNKVVTRSKIPERIGKKRGFPLCGRCAINRDSKLPPIKHYYRDNGHTGIMEYLGIAIDEPKRLMKLHENNRVSLLEKYQYTEQMAKEKCEQYGLLSPIYEFSDRGGCWFCPNSSDKQLQHIRENHPQLWGDLLELAEDNFLITQKFNRANTLQEIDQRLARMK